MVSNIWFPIQVQFHFGLETVKKKAGGIEDPGRFGEWLCGICREADGEPTGPISEKYLIIVSLLQATPSQAFQR